MKIFLPWRQLAAMAQPKKQKQTPWQRQRCEIWHFRLSNLHLGRCGHPRRDRLYFWRPEPAQNRWFSPSAARASWKRDSVSLSRALSEICDANIVGTRVFDDLNAGDIDRRYQNAHNLFGYISSSKRGRTNRDYNSAIRSGATVFFGSCSGAERCITDAGTDN